MEPMTFTTMLAVVLSPIAVALLRRPGWPDEVTAILAFVVVTAIYTLGRWLDGTLTWPLGNDFAIGLMAAYGSQQAAYQAVKHTAPMQRLAAFGMPRAERSRMLSKGDRT